MCYLCMLNNEKKYYSAHIWYVDEGILNNEIFKDDQILPADRAQWSQTFCPSSGRVVAPIGGFRGTAASRPTTLCSVWSIQVGFYCLFRSATLSSARNPKHHPVFGDAALKLSQVCSVAKHWLSGSHQEAGGEERSGVFACQNANISAKHTCWHLETSEKDTWKSSLSFCISAAVVARFLHSFQVFPQWFCAWQCKRLQLFSSKSAGRHCCMYLSVVWTQSIFY